MVLLTSAQVSVAISSAIVFMFTTALFLSGYVLQQQTVRDLRAAIKPQLHRPKSAPDSNLDENGYLIDMVRIETQPTKDDSREHLVEVSHSSSASTDGGAQDIAEPEAIDMVGATRWQKAARKKKLDIEAKQDQKPMIDASSPISRKKGKPSTSKTKPEAKPMSRAERRKKIKEQIVAEGQGETFKGYRRRMWGGHWRSG
ncbi:uncharacterized protein RAG0_07927 [Rhynchosporium agropyri]|uniref:Uncharacterized protein n=1 Tax=Rhynchosporium agropyri TaxID=914238 RepID=A0A1E1KNK7_9HELO|nr:uncharacterized protein RAG0_07927 [Rhynchosporium agropyri]